MSDLDTRIDQRIRQFVHDLNALVRSAALEAVSSALGHAPKAIAKLPPVRAAAAAVKAPTAKARRARAKGEKRSKGEIEAVAAKLAAYIAANPGRRIEPIGQALSLPTSELALPIAKLLKGGQIRREGQRRATKYYPKTGGAKAAKPAKAASPRKGKGKGGRKPAKK